MAHAVLLLTSIGLQLLNPQILRYFINTALVGGSSTFLALAGLLFIGITLVVDFFVDTAYASPGWSLHCVLTVLFQSANSVLSLVYLALASILAISFFLLVIGASAYLTVVLFGMLPLQNRGAKVSCQ